MPEVQGGAGADPGGVRTVITSYSIHYTKLYDAFQKLLNEAGMIAPVRRTRGDDIDAACGQLKGQVECPYLAAAARVVGPDHPALV